MKASFEVKKTVKISLILDEVTALWLANVVVRAAKLNPTTCNISDLTKQFYDLKLDLEEGR